MNNRSHSIGDFFNKQIQISLILSLILYREFPSQSTLSCTNYRVQVTKIPSSAPLHWTLCSFMTHIFMPEVCPVALEK